MRWARPSTTAVLPTPGSPISTGLFLVRRDSTCTTRRISVSRPMTGSSLPSRAARGEVDAVLLRAPGRSPRGRREVTCAPPRTRSTRLGRASRRRHRASRSSVGGTGAAGREAEQQVLGRDVAVAELRDARSIAVASDPLQRAPTGSGADTDEPLARGRLGDGRLGVGAHRRAARRRRASSSGPAMPVGRPASSASSRCAGSTAGLPSRSARRLAAAKRLLALRGQLVGVHLISQGLVIVTVRSARTTSGSSLITGRSADRRQRRRSGRQTTSALRCSWRRQRVQLGLQLAHPRAQRGDLVLELEDARDAGEVDALAGQPRTSRSTRDVARGVAPAAAGGAARRDQPEPVVLPQRLRVQAGQLGGDRDDEDRRRRRRTLGRRRARRCMALSLRASSRAGARVVAGGRVAVGLERLAGLAVELLRARRPRP